MGGLVLLDLWSVERRYIQFSPPARESFAPDAIVKTLQGDSGVYRVLSINEYQGLENYLMSQRVRSVLGYHGNELQRYDELLGGKNEWRNIGSPNLLKLLAVRYVIINEPISTTLLAPVGDGPLATADGQAAYLYRVTDPVPYAFLVEEALQLGDSQTVADADGSPVRPPPHPARVPGPTHRSCVAGRARDSRAGGRAGGGARAAPRRPSLRSRRPTRDAGVSVRVGELSPGLARHGRWPARPASFGPSTP